MDNFYCLTTMFSKNRISSNIYLTLFPVLFFSAKKITLTARGIFPSRCHIIRFVQSTPSKSIQIVAIICITHVTFHRIGISQSLLFKIVLNAKYSSFGTINQDNTLPLSKQILRFRLLDPVYLNEFTRLCVIT